MSHDAEPLEEFRERARTWIRSNLPTRDAPPADPIELQRHIYDDGFAGLAFPIEYGGAGLTLQHQQIFYDLAHELDRQVPTGTALMVSVGMLAPTLLDHASVEACARFLPPLLRGDETWIQLLSEPRGGSDMAGATTGLTRDGDTCILSGSKMWSSGAHESDYGLCLARSNWEAPKHRGLSMIAVPLSSDTDGLTLHRTRAADGTLGDFCEEFFDDVALPAGNLIGEENNGWAVAQTLLFHERNAVGNIGYGYVGRSRRSEDSRSQQGTSAYDLITTVRRRGIEEGPEIRRLIADVHIEQTVSALTSARVMTGMRVGTHTGQWGSLLKLQRSEAEVQRAKAALVATGADGVVWDGEDVQTDNPGTRWLSARGSTLAGGSSEMQRNIISERLLGLPREPSVDRDVPFNEVLRNQRDYS